MLSWKWFLKYFETDLRFICFLPVNYLEHLHFKLISCMWYLDEPQHDKTNKMTAHPAKTQISLGFRPVWSESSLSAQLVAKDPSFLPADSEDADQTGRMPRLIWVFAGRTVTLLVLSCRGSDVDSYGRHPCHGWNITQHVKQESWMFDRILGVRDI